ncbi:MAG: hypothetical protein RRB12_01005 [Armatimonadota bacterium]|nr:hypothetical protein [Armatimonadota bacterium]
MPPPAGFERGRAGRHKGAEGASPITLRSPLLVRRGAPATRGAGP